VKLKAKRKDKNMKKNIEHTSIKGYLPGKASEKTLVQGHVPTSVYSDVKLLMGAYNWAWTDVLSAVLKRLLDEYADELPALRKKGA
jgi:hypothetical protein